MFWIAPVASAVAKVATTNVPMIGGGGGAMNGTTEAVFDNSGWNVAFSGASVSSSAQKTIDQGATSTGQPGLQSPYGAGMGYNQGGGLLTDTTLIYGAAALLLIMALRRKRGA